MHTRKPGDTVSCDYRGDHRGRATRQYSHAGLAGCVTRFRSRVTKTIVGIYRAEQAGIEQDPEIPWVTVCEEHSTLVGHATLALARSCRSPTDFCDECRERFLCRVSGHGQHAHTAGRIDRRASEIELLSVPHPAQ